MLLISNKTFDTIFKRKYIKIKKKIKYKIN